MIINAINGNGNRLIRVNKDTNKDAVKEFLVTTLSQCDTNGHFIETPYSESKLLDKYLGEVVLNIYVTNLYPEPIGEYILDIQDDNFGNRPHLDMWYVKQQVDKYWNTFDAHNPIYHPYHNTSNFVSVEEFYERYKKDNPSYELTKDYSSRKYAEYTDEMVFKSAIHILREENNGKPFNFLQEIEEILFSFNLWDDWDVLDCPRKIYYGIIKDKEIFRQLLNKYYWKPTLVINANPRYK